MPVRDFVRGPDMYDHRREGEAPASARGVQAAAPAAARARETSAWRKGSITEEFAAEIEPTGDPGASRRAPDLVLPPAEPDAPTAWQVIIERMRIDRRIHLAAAALALATLIIPLVVDQLSVVPVGRIRRDPVGFDGQRVKLRGTVGQVFAVGSSFTYYLHNGRDTIVVFTRLQPPRSRQRITVIGSVSTGYLEGVPRAALFQNAP